MSTATEYHLGLLKAKLAKYRAQLLEGPKTSGQKVSDCLLRPCFRTSAPSPPPFHPCVLPTFWMPLRTRKLGSRSCFFFLVLFCHIHELDMTFIYTLGTFTFIKATLPEILTMLRSKAISVVFGPWIAPYIFFFESCWKNMRNDTTLCAVSITLEAQKCREKDTTLQL